jgi:hypothetical protein
MKPISWNAEKNALLKAERGVSFEDVGFHIMAGDILDTVVTPTKSVIPGSRFMSLPLRNMSIWFPSWSRKKRFSSK